MKRELWSPSETEPLTVLQPVQRLIVIGDLHLGRGDPETGFADSPADLTRTLDRLETEADLVILNGDIYDLDRGRFPTAQGWEYRALRPRWAAVEALLARAHMRATAGNHDAALYGRMLGGGKVTAGYRLQVGALDVQVEHGHRFDAWLKQRRRFTSSVTWLSGLVSQGPLRPIYKLLRTLESATTDDDLGGPAERAARWLQEERGPVDLLIIGHTHRRLAERVGARWLLNPGASTRLPLRALRIDGSAETAEFGEVDAERGFIVNQRLALSDTIGNANGRGE